LETQEIIGKKNQAITTDDTVESFNFNFLLKNYFNYEAKQYDIENRLKEAARFKRFRLPFKLNEFVFSRREAPLIWIADLRINNNLKDYYKNNFPRVNGVDHYKSMREFYSKWLLLKSESEKKYFALTLLNLIEKVNVKNNYYGLILSGVILSYDIHHHNPWKALDYFYQADEIINGIMIDEDFRLELRYILQIFCGNAFLFLNKYEEAKEYFTKALSIFPEGITAKINLASAETMLNNNDTAEYLLKDILVNESRRIEYSIENNNNTLLGYFLEHPAYLHLSQEKELAIFADALNTHLGLIRTSNEEIKNLLKLRVDQINEEKKFNGYSEEIINKILFIKSLVELAFKTNHIMLYNSAEAIQNEYNKCISDIILTVKKKHYKSVGEKLVPFEEQIKENNELIENLTRDVEEKKAVVKGKLNSMTNIVETQTATEISACEESISGLNDQNNHSSQKVFTQTMGYNIMLTIIVSLMGGCAGYSNGSVKDISELKNLLSISIMSGLKWGIISFLIGLLIALAVTVFSFLERSNKRQKLLKRISQLKNEKEQIKMQIRKEAENKGLKIIESFNAETSRIKSIIEDLTSQKNKKEAELIEEAEKLFSEEAQFFEALLI
jgi:hypothetical protein